MFPQFLFFLATHIGVTSTRIGVTIGVTSTPNCRRIAAPFRTARDAQYSPQPRVCDGMCEATAIEIVRVLSQRLLLLWEEGMPGSPDRSIVKVKVKVYAGKHQRALMPSVHI